MARRADKSLNLYMAPDEADIFVFNDRVVLVPDARVLLGIPAKPYSNISLAMEIYCYAREVLIGVLTIGT